MTAMLCHRIPRYPKGGLKLDGRVKNRTLRMVCRKPESDDEFGESITYHDALCHLPLLREFKSHILALSRLLNGSTDPRTLKVPPTHASHKRRLWQRRTGPPGQKYSEYIATRVWM